MVSFMVEITVNALDTEGTEIRQLLSLVENSQHRKVIRSCDLIAAVRTKVLVK